MAKPNLAAELAEKLLQVLRDRRGQGEDAYPLTLGRLVVLADPAATEDLRAKAIKHRLFSSQIILAGKKGPDTPLALAEDIDRLADSRLLLEWALERACTSKAPAQPVDKVSKKVDKALRQPLSDALERRIRDNALPETVGALELRKKTYLYLKRMPPPKPPAQELAERLVAALRARRDSGSYPATTQQLVDTVRVEAKLVKKALAEETFRAQVILAVAKNFDGPVVLRGDESLLVASPLLLHFTLALARSESNQAVPLTNLKKKVSKDLQPAFERAILDGLSRRALPAGLGALRIKKKDYLFLMRDVQSAGPPAPVLETHAGSERPVLDFATAFDEAFTRLDQRRGSPNFVSLVDLRRELPVDRDTFNRELRNLRRAGRFTLNAAEGRDGLTPEEQDAAVREEGTLLLFVSRKPT
jgi:hypothetical protein